MKKIIVMCLLAGMSACSDGSSEEDKCENVVCQTPPADVCQNSQILVVYAAQGECNPDSGECQYSSSQVPCADGCQDGECLGDPCAGVSCDQPPDNFCMDANILVVYEEPGQCNPGTGECEYDFSHVNCQDGCQDGSCLGNPCEGVTCDQAPDDYCLDENTLIVFQAEGTCDPTSGLCDYPYSQEACQNGCQDGVCVSDLCSGVICDTPPPNICQDENTLIVYQAQGQCDQETGSCNYPYEPVTCEDGCQDGQCLGDPCEGVVCDQPPPDHCKDDQTLLEYDDTGICDSETGQCSYPAQEVTCPLRCQDGVCIEDLGDDFGLLAPPDTRLCTLWNHFDPYQVLRLKSRLSFKSGLFRLPRNQAQFQLDLIESVEIAPDGELLTPMDVGQVNRTIQGDPDTDGAYQYTYLQDYALGGEVYQLTIRATFRMSGGICDRPIITVDDADYLYDQCGAITPSSLVGTDWQNGYVTCRFDIQPLFTHSITAVEMVNGDLIRFHLRLSYRCCCMLPGEWAEVVKTEFQRGQQHVVVDDFFNQAFTADHHIFGQTYLVVLDPPVDEVHGLLMDQAESESRTFQYLDADLNPIATPDILSVEFITQ